MAFIEMDFASGGGSSTHNGAYFNETLSNSYSYFDIDFEPNYYAIFTTHQSGNYVAFYYLDTYGYVIYGTNIDNNVPLSRCVDLSQIQNGKIGFKRGAYDWGTDCKIICVKQD